MQQTVGIALEPLEECSRGELQEGLEAQKQGDMRRHSVNSDRSETATGLS